MHGEDPLDWTGNTLMAGFQQMVALRSEFDESQRTGVRQVDDQLADLDDEIRTLEEGTDPTNDKGKEEATPEWDELQKLYRRREELSAVPDALRELGRIDASPNRESLQEERDAIANHLGRFGVRASAYEPLDNRLRAFSDHLPAEFLNQLRPNPAALDEFENFVAAFKQDPTRSGHRYAALSSGVQRIANHFVGSFSRGLEGQLLLEHGVEPASTAGRKSTKTGRARSAAAADKRVGPGRFAPPRPATEGTDQSLEDQFSVAYPVLPAGDRSRDETSGGDRGARLVNELAGPGQIATPLDATEGIAQLGADLPAALVANVEGIEELQGNDVDLPDPRPTGLDEALTGTDLLAFIGVCGTLHIARLRYQRAKKRSEIGGSPIERLVAEKEKRAARAEIAKGAFAIGQLTLADTTKLIELLQRADDASANVAGDVLGAGGSGVGIIWNIVQIGLRGKTFVESKRQQSELSEYIKTNRIDSPVMTQVATSATNRTRRRRDRSLAAVTAAVVGVGGKSIAIALAVGAVAAGLPIAGWVLAGVAAAFALGFALTKIIRKLYKLGQRDERTVWLLQQMSKPEDAAEREEAEAYLAFLDLVPAWVGAQLDALHTDPDQEGHARLGLGQRVRRNRSDKRAYKAEKEAYKKLPIYGIVRARLDTKPDQVAEMILAAFDSPLQAQRDEAALIATALTKKTREELLEDRGAAIELIKQGLASWF